MSMSTEKASLFAALRDVLFEHTSASLPKVSRDSRGENERLGVTSPELEAARAALRQSLADALGPGISEFALQIEALREVLPDAQQRKRAALRVLLLKGIAAPVLVEELELALSRLSEQHATFLRKLATRRGSIEEQRSRAVEAWRSETSEAEQAIARLRGELDAAQARLAEASRERDRSLAACEQSAARLAEKQLGFERAHAELHDEYTTLQRQLSNPESA
jgi:chromosome segregation ATPase